MKKCVSIPWRRYEAENPATSSRRTVQRIWMSAANVVHRRHERSQDT